MDDGNSITVSAKRTHHLMSAPLKLRPFLMLAIVKKHQLTIRRHNKVLRGETQYRCRHCQAILQFIERELV